MKQRASLLFTFSAVTVDMFMAAPLVERVETPLARKS